MKKLLSVILISILLTAASAFPTAAVSKLGYEKKMIPAELFDTKDPVKLTCLFRKDLPTIPYLSVEDFLNQIFTEKVSVIDNKDNSFTFVNGKEEMVIDVDRDTIHFDQPEKFCAQNAKPFLDEEKAEYISEDSELEEIGEHHSADLDLSKYDIDITAADGAVYLPYCTLNDLFSNNYRAVLYDNRSLTFTETMDEGNFSERIDSAEKREKSIVDFTYRELCFIFDHLYGEPSSAILSESIGKVGFDKTLESYSDTTAKIKKLLLSESKRDFCVGVMLLDCYLADGGHTQMSYGVENVLSQSGLYDLESIIDEDLIDLSQPDLLSIIQSQVDEFTSITHYQTLKGAKTDACEQFTVVNIWDDAALYQADSTFLFDFEEFKDAVIDPYKWSLDYAKEHGGKNFVIDLSTNIGGSDAVSAYMLSFMAKDSEPLMVSAISGNTFRSKNIVDKNLDDKFDDKDEKEAYDFNFAVLTSSASFSCANLMSCTAQDHGIVILGETSGGGCCNIAPHFYPEGGIFTISGSSKLIHDNGEDFDSGATPDVPLPGAEDGYEGFYDIRTMNAGIEAFYRGDLKPESKGEAAEKISGIPTEQPEPDDYLNIIPYLIIVAIAAASVLILAVVIVIIVVIVYHKKKKYHP